MRDHFLALVFAVVVASFGAVYFGLLMLIWEAGNPLSMQIILTGFLTGVYAVVALMVLGDKP